MRFSIITITYNAEKYLEETLSSVLKQSFNDYEHIIWDGGSQDGTLEIAKRFSHVKLFQGKDLGISDAMNKGAAFAKGDFLIHLHADDLFAHSEVLEEIEGFLKNSPQTLWGYGRAHVINASGNVIRTSKFIPFSSKRLKRYNFITHPATFISTALFMKSGGFKSSLRFCMDYDLWLRLSKISVPLAMPQILACFREHPASLSTKEQLGVANEAYEVRKEYTDTIWERWKSYRTWKKRIKGISNKDLFS